MPSLERDLARNFITDQKNFWTSPVRLRAQDASWLVPLAAGATIIVLSDGSIEKKLPTSPSLISRSKSFSDYGAAGYAGLVAGGYLWARATNNDHLRETAVLSGEAAANSLLITEGIKYIAGRQRPLEGDGTGDFRRGGSSFPSMHATGAWSIASVIAHEYPGPLTQLLAYGSAAAISAARVTGRQHFASDALVGSAVGWYLGRQVYNAHHDRQDLAQYGIFRRTADRAPRDPDYMGSPYVPLDSWVYPAIDRLAALGYIDTAFSGLRPWTRMECARFLEEAQAKLSSDTSTSSVVHELYDALHAEFAVESRRRDGSQNLGASIESIYTRITEISGTPLTDGYHFGQTIVNDSGRPYEGGFNAIVGTSSHFEAGPLAVYVRGEFQHSPDAPGLSTAVRQTIAAVDSLPVVPAGRPVPEVDRFRLLDAYVALNLHTWQLSFGNQSLSWGPGRGGSMMLSDNAEPITMVRASQTTPVRLPSIFSWLGAVRSEFFLGRLSGFQLVQSPTGMVGNYGQSLDSQPFIHGQKLSFKPTPNFEFGISRTTIYGGPGYPLTAQTFFRSLFATGNEFAGAPQKPGDRRSGIDFSYRIPKVRDWLTFYADGFTDDEISPIAYFDRSAWRAGLHMARLPKIPRLELRAEGEYTDNPLGGALGHGFYYFNLTWRSGYTNNGELLGNWIGRQGQGAQAWATYHLSAKNSIEFDFRHQKVSKEFLPNGGTLSDGGVRGEFWINAVASLSTSVRVENWSIPVLAAGRQSNVTTSFQFTYWPRSWNQP